jgi:hypothetical protein
MQRESDTKQRETGKKRPYSKPRLTVHGDLRVITAAKGGTKQEAGRPRTFVGGPA